MKITISHTQSSIDPSGTYSDEEFPAVRKALESEYQAALLAEYPDAEIEFVDADTTYSIRVTSTGLDDPRDIQDTVQGICEGVFETGNFWV
jgi:hypothetical protein